MSRCELTRGDDNIIIPNNNDTVTRTDFSRLCSLVIQKREHDLDRENAEAIMNSLLLACGWQRSGGGGEKTCRSPSSSEEGVGYLGKFFVGFTQRRSRESRTKFMLYHISRL